MKHLFILFCMSSLTMFSQNIPTPSVYLVENQYLTSSAWAGIGDAFKFRGIATSQWRGVENAPSTYIGTLSGRVTDKSGFGVILLSDENGFTSTNSATLSYAYHVILDYYDDEFLSFGISGRTYNFNIDTSNFNNSEIDPIIDSNRRIREFNFDLGSLYRRGNFFISLNFSDILERDDNFSENEPLTNSTFSIFSGLELKQKNYWSLIPSIRYQNFFSDGRSETDLNFKILKDDVDFYYWAATVLKLNTSQNFSPLSFTPVFGLKYRDFYLSYAYQVAIKETRTELNQNLHMISIGFDFLKRQSDCKCTH